LAEAKFLMPFIGNVSAVLMANILIYMKKINNIKER